MSPCPIASLEMSGPARLSAQRSPAMPRSAGRFWAWIDRTRAARPAGETTTPSPAATLPDSTVPVTTVPAPCRVKQRSTASRKAPSPRRAFVSRALPARSVESSGRPSPVSVETGRIGASVKQVSASRLAISAATSDSRAPSARSAFVSATTVCSIPSSRAMATCSRVCGITPSSAATTSSRRSMPEAPASIVCTNFSWPGTSMKPMTLPSGCCQ
ncbi:hypothetical protein BTHI11S_04137 [Bosea thiooxidans]